MDITIEHIQELVTKASAINSLNPEGDLRNKLRDLIDRIDRDLKVFKIEEHRRTVRRELEDAEIEKKIQKEFSNMTQSLVQLVKIRSL